MQQFLVFQFRFSPLSLTLELVWTLCSEHVCVVALETNGKALIFIVYSSGPLPPAPLLFSSTVNTALWSFWVGVLDRKKNLTGRAFATMMTMLLWLRRLW